MGLPKQVRQQIADAKRIEGEIKAAQEAPTPPADPTTTPPTPAEPPVVEASQPTQQPAPQPAPQPDAQYAELLQQYRSLQGIHRGMAQNNRELQSQVENLQSSIQGLSDEIKQLKQSPAPPATPSPVITDEEIREFGPDLISVIERKAQMVAAPLNAALSKSQEVVDQLVARNTELEKMLNGISREQAENAQDRFTTRLVQLVPDFNTLNYDQNFLSWLSQVDPLDAQRKTLQQRLNEAVEAGDAETAASYFNTFKTLVKPAPVQRPKPDLSAQAQPTSRPVPDGNAPPPGRLWTQAEISNFYADISKGKYSPQEKVRIEKDIFKAQQENRIAA